MSSFVGRRDEIAWLEQQLVPGKGSGRVVSLVGVGGVGKTRLALKSARSLREAYPDGVWLVELAPLPTAAGMAAIATLVALRLVDQTTRPPTEVLSLWVQDKRMLLILDSCEHMLADCVSLVPDLLAAAPELRVLVTSRERLGLPDERTLHVSPLPVSSDAVALFADRAVAADPAFVLNDSNQPSVASICGHLDGIPLAIELAAARLSDFSLDQLHRDFDRTLPSRLNLLAADQDEKNEGLARHRTLRATIGWSHELCQPLERLLWARLSVFTDGFRADAAQVVCADGPLPAGRVSELIARLVEQSVVLPHTTDLASFRMLDTVREYGADWLRELGEECEGRLRHRDYYLRLARDASAEFNTERQEAWCQLIRLENANLRAAVDWSLEQPDQRVALEVACAAGFLWMHSGNPREHWSRITLALATEPAHKPDNIHALWLRGVMSVSRRDWDATSEWDRRCADVGRNSGDSVAAAVVATHVRGCNLVVTGRLDEAIAFLSAAEQLPLRDDWIGTLQLQTRLSLSFAHLKRGDYQEAFVVACEICEESRRRGEHIVGAAADSILAQVNLVRGEIECAVSNATRAVQRHAKLHDACSLAMDLDVLAAVIAGAGDSHRAARIIGIGQRMWDVTVSLADSPPIATTRLACERQVRGTLGDRAFEVAYEEGFTMSYEEGLTYATQAPH
jgi:predicted ATPase